MLEDGKTKDVFKDLSPKPPNLETLKPKLQLSNPQFKSKLRTAFEPTAPNATVSFPGEAAKGAEKPV